MIEEIARVYGYRNISSAPPPASMNMRRTGFRERLEMMRQVLVQRGYQEAITYSFVSHTLQSRFIPGCRQHCPGQRHLQRYGTDASQSVAGPVGGIAL